MRVWTVRARGHDAITHKLGCSKSPHTARYQLQRAGASHDQPRERALLGHHTSGQSARQVSREPLGREGNSSMLVAHTHTHAATACAGRTCVSKGQCSAALMQSCFEAPRPALCCLCCVAMQPPAACLSRAAQHWACLLAVQSAVVSGVWRGACLSPSWRQAACPCLCSSAMDARGRASGAHMLGHQRERNLACRFRARPLSCLCLPSSPFPAHSPTGCSST